MKILVTGFTGNYGGVETFIINHYIEMKKLDSNLKIDIISTSKEPAFHREVTQMGGNVWIIPRARYKWKQRNVLRKIMVSENYDVLWCNKCDLADITFLKVASQCAIPVRIIHSHNSQNLYDGLKGKIVTKLHFYHKKQLKNYATDYWACSDYAAEWLFPPTIIKKSQYTFIPNAINCEKFRFQKEIRDHYREKFHLTDQFVVGCIGRFSYQKNPEFTLEIFRELVKKEPNVVLVWIGAGELQSNIMKLVTSYGLNDNVLFLGVRQDVSQWMQAMDCLLLPSRFEGLPVVAVEAQASGLPVFAAREGISRQTQISDSFCFLSLEESSADWATKILETRGTCNRIDGTEILKCNGFEIGMASKSLLGTFNLLLERKFSLT